MEFKDVRANNRIQIECEHENPIYRSVKGIVLEVGQKSLILVTDFGELMEIYEDQILSITQINFPKIVSEALVKIKAYYTEIYELEMKLGELQKEEKAYKEALYDANFLSKFNIKGAKNRLDNSIPQHLLFFKMDMLSYEISFQSNPNNQIEIHVLVSNRFEYPNLDMKDKDKIIRIHAPDARELLKKCFPFASLPKEIEKNVLHEGGSNYSVRTSYCMNVDVDEESFLNVRDQIIKGLEKLRK